MEPTTPIKRNQEEEISQDIRKRRRINSVNHRIFYKNMEKPKKNQETLSLIEESQVKINAAEILRRGIINENPNLIYEFMKRKLLSKSDLFSLKDGQGYSIYSTFDSMDQYETPCLKDFLYHLPKEIQVDKIDLDCHKEAKHIIKSFLENRQEFYSAYRRDKFPHLTISSFFVLSAALESKQFRLIEEKATVKPKAFFDILARLPVEIKMRICNLTVPNYKHVTIPSYHIDDAIEDLDLKTQK